MYIMGVHDFIHIYKKIYIDLPYPLLLKAAC